MFKYSMSTLSRLTRTLPFLAAIGAPLLFGTTALAQEGKYNCPDLEHKGEISDIKSAMYQGLDGWIFRTDDVEHSVQVSDKVNVFLRQLNEILKHRGVKLVLMPIPSRALIEHQFLPPDGIMGSVIYDFDFARQGYADQMAVFRSLGLKTVDLVDFIEKNPMPEGKTFFFSHDFHWFPAGAEKAADAVADTLKDDPTYQGLEKKTFQTTVAVKDHLFSSPVVLLLNQICKDKIAKEKFDIYKTAASDQSLDSFLETDTAAKGQVHLIGTSFSDDRQQYNFAGFLSEKLQLDVVNYGLSGGEVDQSLFWWTHDLNTQKNLPTFLVWEIPYFIRLNTNVDYMERQILPAALGSCKGTPEYVSGGEYKTDGHVDVQLPQTKITGSKYYLAGTFSDASQRDISVKIAYEDQKTEVTPLEMPPRVRTIENFFLGLSDDYQGAVSSIGVDFGGGKPMSGELMICKYPDSLLNSGNF